LEIASSATYPRSAFFVWIAFYTFFDQMPKQFAESTIGTNPASKTPVSVGEIYTIRAIVTTAYTTDLSIIDILVLKPS